MYEFDKIFGNENIINTLKNSIKNNTIANAYIFDGDEKTGKETIAMAFAKSILCLNSYYSCCNNCPSCLTFDKKNNPDLIYLKSDKATISVEDIREKILKEVNIKPFNNKYKVFIIKNAHSMTIQAQNAILKTLEEPPLNCVFILLSKNYKILLQTIISRCILFKINPIKPSLIEKYLINSNIEIDKKNIPIYVSYSLGSIGRAIEIATNKDFFEIRKFTLDEISKMENNNLIQMYESINNFEKYKEHIQKILDIFLLTYRDAIIYKLSKNDENIIQKDISYILKNLSNLSFKRLTNNIQEIINSKLILNQNSNFFMTLECLFLKLKER